MIEKVNPYNVAKANRELYVYEKVGRLNGHVLSVVNVENRTLPFHIHENSDELFYVLDGDFTLEIENEGPIHLEKGEMVIVPKGVSHRPVVTTLTRTLQIELEGTLNKENSGEFYED